MKKTPLKRKTPLRAKKGFKRKKPTKAAKKRTRAKIARPRGKKSTPSIKTLRNKCDNLLTPIIQKKYPRCLLKAPNCAGVTQVAHHHVHKSKSTRLRYELDNLIPLCGHCHVVLHNNESYWASVIITKKGIEWFEELQKKGQETVQVNKGFYKENYERLSQLL